MLYLTTKLKRKQQDYYYKYMPLKENKIKYILYARKSTESEDRQILSIESQINEVAELAQKEKLNIIQTITESKSAKEPGRKKFNEMINLINSGKASGIICWKLDRLARNPIDGGRINWMLQQGIIQHIKTFGRDWYPTDNVLMMSVEFGMANQFILDLSSNTKRGLKTKVKQGWLPQLAPPGYLNNPLKKKKDIINDPNTFDLIKKTFSLMLTGNYTISEILKKTDSWGYKNKAGKKMSKTTLYSVFTRSFYYGKFEYPAGSDNWYQGKHEPMINVTEYDRIQELLGRKGRPRPQKHSFPFRGLIRCGSCGATITPENKTKHQKNGNIHHYTYYHCTRHIDPCCIEKSIRGKELNEQILRILKRIEIPIEFHQWAIKRLKKENEIESKDRNLILKTQQNSYEACIKKIDRLIDMRANNEINEEEFKRKKAKINKEKFHLEELLQDTEKRVDDWLDNAEKVFNFAEKARERFENGSSEAKERILSSLGSNLLLKDGKLALDVKKPLISIKEVSLGVNVKKDTFEPLEMCSVERKNRDLVPVCPTWLRRWDSNPRQAD